MNTWGRWGRATWPARPAWPAEPPPARAHGQRPPPPPTGTKLRAEEEIAQFGIAFVCLCLGVPVGSVGQVDGEGAAAPNDAEVEGIQKARELLGQMGCPLPSLSKEQVEELLSLIHI